MTADEIKQATIDQLLETRLTLLGTRAKLKLRTATNKEKSDYKTTLLQVQHAILELQNKQLAEIRDKLVANEKALGQGIESLKKSLKTIENIKTAVVAIGQFLKIVGKVVKLLALLTPATLCRTVWHLPIDPDLPRDFQPRLPIRRIAGFPMILTSGGASHWELAAM